MSSCTARGDTSARTRARRHTRRARGASNRPRASAAATCDGVTSPSPPARAKELQWRIVRDTRDDRVGVHGAAEVTCDADVDDEARRQLMPQAELRAPVDLVVETDEALRHHVGA